MGGVLFAIPHKGYNIIMLFSVVLVAVTYLTILCVYATIATLYMHTERPQKSGRRGLLSI